MKGYPSTIAAVAAAALVLGCSGANAPSAGAELLAVSPAGGATMVDLQSSITAAFSAPMQTAVFAAVHHGPDVTGPVVDGTWQWSADRMHLTFMPDRALEPGTSYTLHLGGGMMDAEGDAVDLETHGHDMGGLAVTQRMMDDWMMQGGMMGGDGMMGPGWESSTGDTYGMAFTFTTG